MYTDVRPDQIEYVCSKVLGIDGSISIETSQAAMEKHAYGGAWSRCWGVTKSAAWPASFLSRFAPSLLKPGKDFRLMREASTWKLYRAHYEEPRVVEYLDGHNNVWTIRNHAALPSSLAVEITPGTRSIPAADYDKPKAMTIETFDDGAPYRP